MRALVQIGLILISGSPRAKDIIDPVVTTSVAEEAGAAAIRAAGSNAVRALSERFADVVNVLDFVPLELQKGVLDGSGVTDCTGFIQAALDASGTVAVTRGVFRVAETDVVRAGQHLILGRKAILVRRASDVSSNELVRVSGPGAVLSGEGAIVTEKGSPRGVVRLGQSNHTGADQVLRSAVRGLTIQGVKAPGNIGLHVYSSEGYAGPGYVYEAEVSNLHVRFVGTGVLVDRFVNGNTFTSLQFYEVGQHAYRFVSNSENAVLAGFTHYSADATIIKLESSSYNHFLGVLGEPGGNGSRYFDIDARSSWNLIIGHDNATAASVDAGLENTFIWGGQASTPALRLREGRGRHDEVRVLARASAPAAANAPSGGWLPGDIVINSQPGYGAPMGWTAPAGGNPGTWVPLPTPYPRARVTVPFASSMTIAAARGDVFEIKATDRRAFVIDTPIQGAPDQSVTIRVENMSGSALGPVTWGSGYRASKWTPPEPGRNTAITFRYNGTVWEEVCRAVSIPN